MTGVPSCHWNERAEQVREALGAVGVAMVCLAFAGAVGKGYVCEHHATTEPGTRRSENLEGGAAVREIIGDGSCTEVASTRGHGRHGTAATA